MQNPIPVDEFAHAVDISVRCSFLPNQIPERVLQQMQVVRNDLDRLRSSSSILVEVIEHEHAACGLDEFGRPLSPAVIAERRAAEEAAARDADIAARSSHRPLHR